MDGRSRTDGVETARTEIFSDAVFAIAITLLVLELEVPTPGREGLGSQLAEQWESYAAYALSFWSVGIIWISHHAQFGRIQRADHWLLILNLFVLLAVALVPFPTAVMAEYLRAGEDEGLAVALYGANILAMGLTYFAVWEYAARRGLLPDELGAERRRRLRRRNLVGPCSYAAGIGVAFLSPYAALALFAAGGLYYLVPGRWRV